MSYEQILREFSSLPPEGQKDAADFIESLKERYSQANSAEQVCSDLATLSFVGMWHDREEMRDSTAWVRNLRSSQ